MADTTNSEGIQSPNNGFGTKESSFIAAWEQSGGDETKIASAYNGGVVRPSKSSGATIGIGYDLSQHSVQDFHNTWGNKLTPEQYARLDPYCRVTVKKGKKRISTAKKPTVAALKAMRDIQVRYDDAVEVYKDKILPKYIDSAYKQFPGLKEMDPWSRAAVIDIGYTGMGVRNKKQRAARYAELKKAVLTKDTKALAATLRLIASENTIKGVIRRRNSEASMVETHEKEAAAWMAAHPDGNVTPQIQQPIAGSAPVVPAGFH